MVTETEGALPPARRRRRRPRNVAENDDPVKVSVTVVTVILADTPFGSEGEADVWLGKLDDSEFTGDLIDDAISTLDRVRAADAGAAGVPFGNPTQTDWLVATRIGYGPGDQVASGRFVKAKDVDGRGGTGEKRRERRSRTGSLARTAAIIGGNDRTSASEVMIPRIRLDLSTGNAAAARLAIASSVGATISEFEFAVEGEGHEQDLDRLEGLLPALTEISDRAEQGGSDPADIGLIEEALDVAERVIRRRRILDQ